MNAAAIARQIIQDPTQIRDELAIWIQKCRWAGLSGLQYPKEYAVTIDLCQDFSFAEHPDPFLLLGITVIMQSSREPRYFCLILTIVKLSAVPGETSVYPISTFFTPSISKGQWTLRFATLDPKFVSSLLWIKKSTIIVKHGNFTLSYKPVTAKPFPKFTIKESKVLGGGDTTNSIVQVTLDTSAGLHRIVFKSYLRLLEHNIEADMITHLDAVGFSAVPAIEGLLTLRWGKKKYTLLMTSQFVENEGDGGKPFWDHLQEYIKITQSQKYFKSVLQKIGPLAQLVGQTTREFHEALNISKTGDIRQKKVNPHDRVKWEQEFVDNFANASKLWRQRLPSLFPHLLPEITTKISDDLSRIIIQIKSDKSIGLNFISKIQPIHGDLHLGQFLFQPGPPPQFIVTDLEGDPQLPPERRQESRTVWFDLGGLLRALDYIAFFGTFESLKQQILSHPWSAEDVFTLFLVRLAAMDIPPTLEQYRWAGESTVVHALEWAEYVGTQILRGYGVKDRLQDELPIVFKLVRATSELNYELGFRGQNALVPLLGVLSIGNQWLQLKNKG